MRIAIVGAGVSGSSLLKTIINHTNFKTEDQIDVFEPRSSLGAGLPYAPTDDESIMLNIAPEMLSVVANHPNDFVEWLHENYENPTNFEDLVSRPRYGKYLVERFSPYFAHKQVQHIQSEVIDLEVLDAKTKGLATDKQNGPFVYQLKTESGWQKQLYDAVFFSVGHPEYNDFYELKGTKNYIHNPYPMNKKLSGLNNDQKVAVIGSGATGIDLMRYFSTHFDLKHPLTYYDVKEPFHCVNIPFEKGDVTYSLTMDWIKSEKEKHDGFIPLQVILDTIKADLAHEGVDVRKVYHRYKARTLEAYRAAFDSNDQELAAIQQYASKSVAHLPHLFNALTGSDREEYMENYYDMMVFFKSRVPYLSYKWLFELIDAGKLNAVSNLETVNVLDDGQFEFITNGSQTTADVVVNASGFMQNIEILSKHSKLIKHLFDKRIIMSQTNGRFVLVDWPQTRVMNQRFGQMDNLFFLGLLIGGTQHENNDAGLTIQQARTTANAFMDSL